MLKENKNTHERALTIDVMIISFRIYNSLTFLSVEVFLYTFSSVRLVP